MDIKLTREQRIYFSVFATSCCVIFFTKTPALTHTANHPITNTEARTTGTDAKVMTWSRELPWGCWCQGSPTGRGAALVPPESRPALLGATGSRPHDLRGDTGASQLPRVRATISPHTQHHPQLLYHLLTLEAGTTPRMLTDLIILAEFVNEKQILYLSVRGIFSYRLWVVSVFQILDLTYDWCGNRSAPGSMHPTRVVGWPR